MERKPNFDLWPSRGGFPMHDYMLKKCTFLWGHENGHPAWVLHGHVTASKLVPLLTCDEFVSMWAGHVSVFAAVWSFFLCVPSASVGFTFLRWNFEAGQILYSISLSSMMLFKRFEFSIYRNQTELCTTPAWAVLSVQRSMSDVPSYNV